MKLVSCFVHFLISFSIFFPAIIATGLIVKRDLLQDIVTFDANSLFVHGERVMFFSGEFHPFRLPVPGLWLDVFQKIKAMGFNGASFYLHWGLFEGKPGEFSAEGIFAIEPFLEAAKQAGLYLNARPGPYINAEASGGGFPGWMQRINGAWRQDNDAYLNATELYVNTVAKVIAKYQITNGGPVILLQPENELCCNISSYMSKVEKQFRDAGIVVPFMNNENTLRGFYAPGQPAAVDIYGFDVYPFGLSNCNHPDVWTGGDFEKMFNYTARHLQLSPSTPMALPEFQGGSTDGWGGYGFDNCAAFISNEFERVVYKEMYAVGARIMSLYMTYGGTNWGNVGWDGGYTSYDYGAPITEDRLLSREKYSEAKLQANFLKVSKPLLSSISGNMSEDAYSEGPDITITPLLMNSTKFLISRHTAFRGTNSTKYKLKLPTSLGNWTVPRLGGDLTLSSRDSKIHLVDYPVGRFNLVYSTAEVFTWQKYQSKSVLIIYGGHGEQHEMAVQGVDQIDILDGPKPISNTSGKVITINWKVSTTRTLVRLDNTLYIYLIDRNTAYNFWTADLLNSNETIIVKAGYLLRNASATGTTLNLIGDINATTPIEVVGGAPSKLTKLLWNGESIKFRQDSSTQVVTATVTYHEPKVNLPDLSALEWKYTNGLPEISNGYNDEKWTDADLTTSPNLDHPIRTPVSLFGSDYGYSSGALLMRGHFVAIGKESGINVTTQGGRAYGVSMWLDGVFLGSYDGGRRASRSADLYRFPKALSQNSSHVLTVVVDNMGLTQGSKDPRGIIDYDFVGRNASDITWKITGNLGGESYLDKDRGPLNEGGMFPERHGYHLPSPPSADWPELSPFKDGITEPGIGWFVSSFDLDLPTGYDIPLSFVFDNSTAAAGPYRVQLYVNGYQFGKYVPHVGPQKSFPVPEGILNHQGKNSLAVSLWAHAAGGAKIQGLDLVAKAKIQTGYGHIPLTPMTPYKTRTGAY